MKSGAKRTRWWLKLAACAQVSGGFWGVALFDDSNSLKSLRGAHDANWWWSLSLELVLVLVLAASVVGGVLLWRGTRGGVYVSRVVQGLQIIQFQIGGIGYGLIIGIAGLITVNGEEVGIKLQYGSDVLAAAGLDKEVFAVNFNVLAFALLVLLLAPIRDVTAVMENGHG